jgi:hypothetical protein
MIGFVVIVGKNGRIIPKRKLFKTVHCPYCGKWFHLEFQNFVVTYKVVGYHKRLPVAGAFLDF